MLGHRGCRLGVTYPEIYETQVRAIIEAACNLSREGMPVRPQIMVPIVGMEEEFVRMRQLTEDTAAQVMAETGVRVDYTVGTMIELPRACMVADEIARHAEFFSFGTNDLTQTTYGISRDDSAHFMPDYIAKGVIEGDPFVKLDQEGVGELMRIAVGKGRSVRPGLKIGICGEHGGGGGGGLGARRGGQGGRGAAGAEDRHRGRAGGRADVGGVLPPRRAGLRERLALPGADRAGGGGAGGAAGPGGRGRGSAVRRSRCGSGFSISALVLRHVA